MKQVSMALLLLVLMVAGAARGDLVFKKQHVSDVPYEAACVIDVDKDGNADVVCGEYWFAGPDFKSQHKFRELLFTNEYYDEFGNYPIDLNQDGNLDVIGGGWFGKALRWWENPGNSADMWKEHLIKEAFPIERPCYFDIDGDGTVEIVPNTPGGPLVIYRIVCGAGGAVSFPETVVSPEKQDHGLGFGDINGDGRGDLILNKVWFEAPEKPFEQPWKAHTDYDVGHASVPIQVFDVNGDGMNDLIAGLGHDYGLAWWEQGKQGGAPAWTKHDIETDRSQFHDLEMADLDKDGKPELVTGKRYRAHNGKDPGSTDPIGVYYYTIGKGKLTRHDLDYGAPGEASGAGIYMDFADLDKNGWTDVVAPGKDGLYIFWNQGEK